MKLLKGISAIMISLWVLFVSMGLTVYQHVCTITGDVQISINAPVECKHESAPVEVEEEPVSCCHHHKHCKKDLTEEEEEKGPGCCNESQFTFYVRVEDKQITEIDLAPAFHSVSQDLQSGVDPVLIALADQPVIQTRPPPEPPGGRDILLQKATYLI